MTTSNTFWRFAKNTESYTKHENLLQTNTTVEAECDNMKEKDSFDLWIANSKIKMRWNGKVYVGNMSGMEFTSYGPDML